MGDWTVFRLSADASSSGQRLDQWISSQTPELSRSLVRKLVDLGGVHVNGRRTRQCSLQVTADDRVDVFLDGRPLDPFVLKGSDIIFRDDYLIAVDKPAGVETQPTPARFKGTLYHALKSYLQDPARPQISPSVGMVQRLDRDTSGILVFSIHQRAHKGLTGAFSGKEVKKIYLAVTAEIPSPPEGEIRSELARRRADNLVRSVHRGGKLAVTRYRVLSTGLDTALVEVDIPTGRSHQIRAHFSEAGFPLAGDTRYGGPEWIHAAKIPRQMLHARTLQLRHPVSGNPLYLEAAIPGDMRMVLKSLGIQIPGESPPAVECPA